MCDIDNVRISLRKMKRILTGNPMIMSNKSPQLFNSKRNIYGGPIKTFFSVFYNVIVLFLVLCCEYCILLYMTQMRTPGKIG